TSISIDGTPSASAWRTAARVCSGAAPAPARWAITEGTLPSTVRTGSVTRADVPFQPSATTRYQTGCAGASTARVAEPAASEGREPTGFHAPPSWTWSVSARPGRAGITELVKATAVAVASPDGVLASR